MDVVSEVFHEDCMVGMRRYPDKFFDWAICDIPYGINVAKMAYLSEKNTTVLQKNGSRINPNTKKKPFLKKDWDSSAPSQAYFDELLRISNHQIVFGVEYVDWTGLGKGRIKWNKGFSEKVSFKGYEMAYCSKIDYIHEVSILWAGMQQAKSLSEPMTSQGNKSLNEKRIHPCHKPVLLYLKIIKDFGIEGCRVIDTHVGGGSSRIASYRANCFYHGYEIDKEYFDDQQDRFNSFLSSIQPKLF